MPDQVSMKCKSTAVIPIEYGMLTETGIQMVERGEIKAGGCCVDGREPRFYCKDCGHEYR